MRPHSAFSISLGPVPIGYYKLIHAKIKILAKVILQLGAFFKVGVIRKLSVFVMKDYLEAFDRNEASNTQEKERCLQGEPCGGNRSFRELCPEALHSRVICSPIHPLDKHY